MSAVEPIGNVQSQSVAERRMRMPPIPDDFFGLITNEQKIALNQKQQLAGLLSLCADLYFSQSKWCSPILMEASF